MQNEEKKECLTKHEKIRILKEKGYKEYPTGPFDSDGIERCFQKCIKDEKGKCYFIDVNIWEDMFHPATREEIEGGFEYVIYFYNKERLPIKMLFYAGWEIEDVEEYAKKLFATGLFQRYEELDQE